MPRLPLEHHNAVPGQQSAGRETAADTAPAATRAEALRRLEAFVPNAGGRYAKTRNYDYGPANRANVSNLSQFVRHRLISEHEIVTAVLQHHAFSSAEKFIQEVCWRTYWKGWLEQRPQVWFDYLAERDRQLALLQMDGRLFEDWQAATSGKTGIACFDFWARELVETGYLHNHARMWFASIWVFTLDLPWSLGADFFYRHLLDGDPASNTLSWRWVAGRQTIGKTYQARESNIATYTDGRFPETPGLASHAAPPANAPEHPSRRPIEPAGSYPGDVTSAPAGNMIVLLHEDDLTPEQWFLPASLVAGVILLEADHSGLEVAASVLEFKRQAGHDARQRAEQHFGRPSTVVTARPDPAATRRAIADAVVDLSSRTGSAQASQLPLVTMEPPIGPVRSLFDGIWNHEARAGGHQPGPIPPQPVKLRREWDDAFWPHATAGFFKLKNKIPGVLRELGIG